MAQREVHPIRVSDPRRRAEPRVSEYAWEYLTLPDPTPTDVDPQRDLGIHPDDLPTDWHRSPFHTDPDGGVSTMERVTHFLNHAVHWTYNAVYVAGFTTEDAWAFNDDQLVADRTTELLRTMWNYRRYGIPLADAIGWNRAGFTAPVARVYTDAGYNPRTAKTLQRYIDRRLSHGSPNTQTKLRARAVLAVLDHRIARSRAVLYVHANIGHHEIPDWETRRRTGEPITQTLQTLAALNNNH